MKSPISCNHANEVPAKCPCLDEDCYCKQHTCKEVEYDVLIELRKQIVKKMVLPKLKVINLQKILNME